MKSTSLMGCSMGKHENRVVGAAVAIEIFIAALILLIGYLAR